MASCVDDDPFNIVLTPPKKNLSLAENPVERIWNDTAPERLTCDTESLGPPYYVEDDLFSNLSQDLYFPDLFDVSALLWPVSDSSSQSLETPLMDAHSSLDLNRRSQEGPHVQSEPARSAPKTATSRSRFLAPQEPFTHPTRTTRSVAQRRATDIAHGKKFKREALPLLKQFDLLAVSEKQDVKGLKLSQELYEISLKIAPSYAIKYDLLYCVANIAHAKGQKGKTLEICDIILGASKYVTKNTQSKTVYLRDSFLIDF